MIRGMSREKPALDLVRCRLAGCRATTRRTQAADEDQEDREGKKR